MSLIDNANRTAYAEAVGVAKALFCDMLSEFKRKETSLDTLRTLITTYPNFMEQGINDIKNDYDEFGLINDWELVGEVLTKLILGEAV